MNIRTRCQTTVAFEWYSTYMSQPGDLLGVPQLDEFLPSRNTDFGVAVVNRAEATMDAIEQYILTKQLKPGDPLPTEANLCADLGVSRSSVREALRQLQALDIVVVRQGRGAFVGDMSLRPLVKTLVLRSSIATDSFGSLREVVAVRKLLDIGVAQQVVDTMAGERHEDLHALVEEMVRKADAGKKFLDEDIAFHQGLLSGVENSLVLQLTSAMWMIHMAVVPSLPNVEAGLLATAQAHEAMLVTAEAGDKEGYEAAVAEHYRPLLSILDDLDSSAGS